jgi:hypothetical protein
MVSTCPLKLHGDGLRRVRPIGGDDLVDIRRRGIQIAALHVRVDVEHRTNVELRQHHRHGAAAEVRDSSSKSGLRPSLPVRRPASVHRSCDELIL